MYVIINWTDAYVLFNLVLNTSWISQLTDLSHSTTSVVAVLPDHVVATVRRADNVGPVQQTQLCNVCTTSTGCHSNDRFPFA